MKRIAAIGLLIVTLSGFAFLQMRNFHNSLEGEWKFLLENARKEAPPALSGPMSTSDNTNATANPQAEKKIITENDLRNLPAPVQKWLRHSGVVGREQILAVTLEQDGKMRLKPDQKEWISTRAAQIFTTENPAFTWNVHMKMFGLPVLGRDAFSQGKGEMRITLAGTIPLVDVKDQPKLNISTIQRYLGEISWFPSAALHPAITWEAIDELSAKATMTMGDTTGSAIFHFKEDGDLEKFVAWRYRSEEDSQPTEWVAQILRTESVHGLRIPVSLEATWMLPEGPFTWYIFDISNVEYYTASDRDTKSLYREKSHAEDGGRPPLYCPVELAVQPMERLLLVNLSEKDPDSTYLGFEPQYFNDPIQGEGFLVVAWRNDGYVDVFHQPSLTLDPATYEIAGKGLASMAQRPFTGARLVIDDSGAECWFAFEDLAGRHIEFTLKETAGKPRKPFGLLAPMGNAVTSPTSLPLVLLEDFYFVRRAGTELRMEIDGRTHKLDSLPIPLDYSRKYFLRYSPKPLIAKLNPAKDEVLLPIGEGRPGDTEYSQVDYKIIENQGYREISALHLTTPRQNLEIHFTPALPELLELRENAEIRGEFSVSGAKSLGTVAGHYQIVRVKNLLHMEMIPDGGWQPVNERTSLRFLYRVNKEFTQWPKTYKWTGVMNLENPQAVTLKSQWERTKS